MITDLPVSSPFSDRVAVLPYLTIGICFLLNMIVGMNVLIVSYAAPAIGKAWGSSAESLGVVFGAGLLGMTIGAMLLAPYADHWGRRTMLLGCAGLMGTCVLATAFAPGVPGLVLARLLTGVGLGGTLASAATLTSEYAPARTRNSWVSLVMAGYPVGAVLSGLAAARLIPAFGWPALFVVAGIATLLTVPVLAVALAESLDFLLKKQPANALRRANKVLIRLNQPPITALPPLATPAPAKASAGVLLTRSLRPATLRLWLTFALAFSTLYFLTSWIPKLAATTGLSLSLAIYAGAVFNLGAFVGIVTQGYLSARFGLMRVVGGFLWFTAGLMAVFGSPLAPAGGVGVLVLFGLIGFAVQGGAIGLYAAAAGLYPTEIRGTGVGWAIGMGRVGAILGSVVGGWLIGAGLPPSLNFMCFALPVLIAGRLALSTKKSDV